MNLLGTKSRSIVRDLAELYGGTITLEDSPLGGLRHASAYPPERLATRQQPDPQTQKASSVEAQLILPADSTPLCYRHVVATKRARNAIQPRDGLQFRFVEDERPFNH